MNRASLPSLSPSKTAVPLSLSEVAHDTCNGLAPQAIAVGGPKPEDPEAATVSNILVVDDEPLLAYVIRQCFRKQIRDGNYRFVFAQDGRSAVEKIRSMNDSVDMVLTDLKMPKMDGFELLEAIRQADHETKAVVVSAFGDLKNIRAAMNRGAFDFLTKPVDLEDLSVTISKTLNEVSRFRAQQKRLREAQQEIDFLELHDPLTQLANRTWLAQQISRAIRIGRDHKDYRYALLLIDIDRFKLINDSMGHAVGDHVLQCVGERIHGAVKSTGTIARIGGDEFAVLLEPVEDFVEISPVCERILDAIRQPLEFEGKTIYLTACIGITTSTLEYQAAEDAIRDANVAMSDARLQQHTMYSVFHASMHSSIRERMQLEIDMREGIRGGEFRNFYQPIVGIADDEHIGFEVLARWFQPDRGLIMPGDFIPVAEETGLIKDLGWAILKEACRQCAEWNHTEEKRQIFLNVNVSAIQLADPSFAGRLVSLIEEYQIAEGLIRLELTETLLLEESSLEAQQLLEVRAAGVRLCMDDFGTGYSSLSRLHDFPIDTVKIDRSFVSRMEVDPKQRATVKMIVALAQALGMKSVAEGVETEATLDTLREIGCESAQGYLFSPPMDQKKAAAFLDK